MQKRAGRRGSVFSLRLTSDERARIEAAKAALGGPRSLGRWLVWRSGVLPELRPEGVLPARAAARVMPELPAGEVLPARSPATVLPRRRILDLCGGSGSWSAPYRAAGYAVDLVTMPDADVRDWVPPRDVHGVLAAPPCTEFSLAKNGRPRDVARALETVTACLRIIALARPTWWAIENPVGMLSRWLGTPRDVFQPYEFGDAWTKRTALWGDFTLPARGPFVQPAGSAMDRPTAAARARTPPGFARAFFLANP